MSPTKPSRYSPPDADGLCRLLTDAEPRQGYTVAMYRLRLGYSGYGVEERLPALDDTDAVRLAQSLLDADPDLIWADIRTLDDRLVHHFEFAARP